MNFNIFLKKIIIKYFNFFYIFHNLFIKNKIFIDREYYSHSKEDIFILNKFRKKKGFYIDVGCHHPTRLNNCHLLYKNGWRGINIDLNKISIDLFNYVRKDDVNINIAVSSKKGNVKYYYDKPLSLYNSLLKKNYLKYSNIIKSDSLDNIIKRTKFKNKEIDFLSIDVEGKDLDVLKSLNFKKYNPKSICIEIWKGKYKNSIYNFLIKKKYSLVEIKRENFIFLKNKF
jgi:FkbM family methyltransferase